MPACRARSSVGGSSRGTITIRRTARPDLDDVDARLLNEMQERFPLIARPYAELARRLRIDEREVLSRVAALTSNGVVRLVGPIFDTKSLGYASSLVAMRVPADRLEQAVGVVNAHPGVSHNYLRGDDFNVWFTIAMPPGHRLDPVVERIRSLSGAHAARALTTRQLFKIGVTLDVAGEQAEPNQPRAHYSESDQQRAARHELTTSDIEFVRAAQQGLRPVAEPFAAIAEQLGWSTEQTIDRARRLQASGHLRRIAAVLNHRVAGFKANGMAVWAVPVDQVEEFGRLAAGFRHVSHCYERATYPDWPYNVFAMIHGRDRSEVESVVGSLQEQSGVAGGRVLYSTATFKKVRLRYFTPEFDRWEALCEEAASAFGAPVSASVDGGAGEALALDRDPPPVARKS
jgi:DNA-binding Lrp family transcriptional regulator